MKKYIVWIATFLLLISYSYAITPNYYSVDIYNSTKLAQNFIYIQFGNGSDISPCNVVINDVTYLATYSGGNCYYNYTTMPSIKTDFTIVAQYDTDVNLSEISFTFYPTVEIAQEVSAMSFVSVLISIVLVFGGIMFL